MAERLRVLVVGALPPPFSGSETAIQVLMDCGLRDDFEVRRVDTRTTRDPSGRGRISFGAALATARIAARLAAALLRFRPDVANVPLPSNRAGFLKWLVLAGLCRAFGSRVVARLGGSAFDRFHGRSSAPMRALIRSGLKLAAIIIVRGRSLRAQFSGLVAAERVIVVPNGFDVEGWRRELPPRRPSLQTRVLFLGQVSKAKGVFDFLDAVRILAERGAAARFSFTVAGPVIERERNILHLDSPASTSAALAEKVATHPALEQIRFTGEADRRQTLELFASSDVLVMPSYSEGLPYVVLEAFASECAVISTPAGALPDFLHDDEELLFVPVGNLGAIADALLRLGDRGERERLTSRAAGYLRRTHDLPVFRQHMEEVFRAAAERRRPRLPE